MQHRDGHPVAKHPAPVLKVFCQIHAAIDKKNPQAVFAGRFHPPFGLLQVCYQHGTT